MGKQQILVYLFLLCFSSLAAQQFISGDQDERAHHIPLRRVGPPPPGLPRARAATPEWKTIKQKLDNFDPDNNETWNMRYITNGQHWKEGGPVFILIGAEWTINPLSLQSGQIYDIAEQNSAWMFYTEHRYYGQSRPTSDLSTANLKYLTTPQALQDLANFIKYIRSSMPELATSKVVVFGGSYGGSMSTWMRLKYPDLVHAAVASSAPLLAKADFLEYLEVVQDSLELGQSGCTDIIRNAFKQMEEKLNGGQSSVSQLGKDFNLCTPLDVDDEYDVGYMFQTVAETFSGIVQYALGNALKDTCNELNNGAGDDYTRLSRFILARRPYCVGNYDNFVQYFKEPNLTGDSRQWLYQTCTEYGYFQTSASDNQPFGHRFPVQINYKMCKDIFGDNFNEGHILSGIEATNKFFGGLKPNMTRVISVHGTVDPWHALGLHPPGLGPDTPVFLVVGTSHCADMQSLSLSDSKQMTDAKIAEQQLVRQWLQES